MGRRLRSLAREAPSLGAALLILGAVTWPLLFTDSGFAGDWMHHLWLLWHQSLSLRANPLPSFFLHTSYSVFNPIFAFYGGTLYAVGGLLSLALGGSPMTAYVLLYMFGFVAAFGGWFWLGRQVGLGNWAAMVPGLLFVTSAYYVVDAYVRGDLPEFTGVSMIPLMLAAGLSVLRAERLRPWQGAALAVSCILFFGSHNITILLGLTMLAITAAAVVLGVPSARRQIARAGVLRVTGIVVPSALVSAWYLLPTVVYESRTRLGGEFKHAQETLRTTSGLVSFHHLFTLSRGTAVAGSTEYPFALSLPVVAIVWLLIGIPVLVRSTKNRPWRSLLLIFSGVTVLAGIAMTHVGLLLALPRPYTLVQFSYRIEAYVLLGLAGAALAGLALARGRARSARVWLWMAIPVCIVSLLGAVQQIAHYPYPGQDRYAALESYGEVETGNNQDFQDPQPAVDTSKLPVLNIPASAVHRDHVSWSTRLPPGSLLATNIAAGPYMVSVSGAKPVGVDPRTDDMVLSVGAGTPGVDPSAGGARAVKTISISPADGTPIKLGRALSLCALAVLAIELLLVPAGRLLSRRLGVRSGA